MIVYLIPILITFLAAIQYDLKKNCGVGSKTIWYFLFCYLVLLMGFRYEIGGDTLVYMEDYKWRKSISEWAFSVDDYYEPLYTLLCALAKTIGDDFVYFQILHAFILNSCLFYFISKSTPYKFSALLFSFIFYYIYFSTEILRESLAIFVFVLNFKSYENNNWGKYYLGVLVAILFHISAIILIILPFIKWLRLNLTYLFVLILSVFIFIKLNAIFLLFSDLSKVSEKIMQYEDNLLTNTSTLGIILTILSCCRFTIVPVSLYIWDKWILKEHPKYESLICLYIILGIGVWFNSVIFERFPNYITPLYFISIANIIIPSFKKSASISRKCVGAIFLCLILIVYGSFPARIYMRYIPYCSVFNPQSIVRVK